jgi:hypothetical protein
VMCEGPCLNLDTWGLHGAMRRSTRNSVHVRDVTGNCVCMCERPRGAAAVWLEGDTRPGP